jgi:hypothetical protein
VKNPTGQVEHEASTSKIGEEQLLYCRQRGIPEEEAVSMIVNGFCRDGAPCMLFVVFAIVFVLAAAAAFALPELRRKTLPE